MTVWTSSLLIGFLTALRFVSLPALALLVVVSLAWKQQRGAWLPLWKLGVALLVATALGTLGFTLAWHEEVAPEAVDTRPPMPG